MTGMEHAIEQAARVIYSTGRVHLIEAHTAARALHSAGLLVHAPLREEWGRAYRLGDGRLFVDDQDGSFQGRDDVAQFVPPQHPDSPYDLIVKRGVTDWFPADAVDRAEGDGHCCIHPKCPGDPLCCCTSDPEGRIAALPTEGDGRVEQ